jgi:hypothetical protein
MESDTPRTNEEAWTPVDFDEPVVFAAFARQLERELAAAIKQRDEARREVCEMIARTRRKMGISGQTVGIDRVTPAEIAIERGWHRFKRGWHRFKEGGGA